MSKAFFCMIYVAVWKNNKVKCQLFTVKLSESILRTTPTQIKPNYLKILLFKFERSGDRLF
jgi:hypothetical protein